MSEFVIEIFCKMERNEFLGLRLEEIKEKIAELYLSVTGLKAELQDYKSIMF